MLNTTNASINTAIPTPEPIDPLNHALADAKDASAENIVILAKLHKFLFGEERPTEPPQQNPCCMRDCAFCVRDNLHFENRIILDICEKLGM